LTPKQAWQRALQTLIRHPWLALIPMGWNALQMALAWAGIPLGAVPDVGRLADTRYRALLPAPTGAADADAVLRAFLPSWLPSLTDLHLPVQPESLAIPVGLSLAAALAGLLLVPLLHALAQAAFLGLVAQALIPGAPGGALPRILRAVPGLYVLGLLWRMALMIIPVDGLLVAGVIWLLFFPLLPLLVAVGDRPLVDAVLGAPREFWGRLGAWFGIGWRAGLTMMIFHFLWTMAGRLTGIAMLVYPFVATWTVGAAAGLCLVPSEDAPPAPARAVARRWAVTIAVGILLAAAGTSLSGQWAGYRVTREAALDDRFLPTIVLVKPEGPTELILYRKGEDLGIAELARSRFGWKLLWQEEQDHSLPVREGKPAAIHWGRPGPGYGRFLIWGELFDSRAAVIDIDGTGFALSPVETVFLIPVSEAPAYEQGRLQNLRLLDPAGKPLPLDGGTAHE
jgi:hypothetical protein